MLKSVSTPLCAAIVVLLLAAPTHAETTHVVESGEFLGSIAQRYECSVADIRAWNRLDGDMIRVGQQLRIESGSSAGSTSGAGDAYEVRPGDTLLGIAIANDCEMADLVAWNPGINPDRIRVGQELAIRTGGARASRTVMYEVQRGDFLGRIASRHDVTVAEIEAWNPGLDGDMIRVGQELRLVLRGPEQRSESVGRAHDGRLVHGELLPPHRAYTIRDPNRSWATNETVGAIVDGFDHMRRRFDELPRVEVHDLSWREGGDINDHRSHESGRDADIGYYHNGCRRDCSYRQVDADDLDVARQWALFSYWIERDLVDYVFVTYAYQEVLYEYARSQGASRSELSRWFQYPRGRDVAAGVIRHEPNHADHFHARFSCDPMDAGCR